MLEIKQDKGNSVINITNQPSKLFEKTYRVKEISEDVKIPHEGFKAINFNKDSTKSRKKCRICYCDDTEVNSPLMTPCKCSGSMSCIHFSCLQNWLKSKVIVKSHLTENVETFYLKKLECELCKEALPGNYILN